MPRPGRSERQRRAIGTRRFFTCPFFLPSIFLPFLFSSFFVFSAITEILCVPDRHGAGFQPLFSLAGRTSPGALPQAGMDRAFGPYCQCPVTRSPTACPIPPWGNAAGKADPHVTFDDTRAEGPPYHCNTFPDSCARGRAG